MKQSIISTLGLACSLALATSASAAIEWTGATDNDFATSSNWATAPSTGDDLYINTLPYAEVSTDLDLSYQPDDLYVANASGASGSLVISSGANVVLSNRFRAGLGANSTADITISGGSLSVPNTYTTIGNPGGTNVSTVTVTMTGGTWSSDRQTWAQDVNSSVTLNMSGGAIVIDYTDASPASTSGSLRMALGSPNLNISGTGSITAHTLRMLEGGTLHLTGGMVDLLGPGIRPDSTPDPATSPFDFTMADITGSLVNGQIVFDGGTFQAAGNQEALLDAAISAGIITTNQAGWNLDALYLPGSDVTVLVPEPASLALIALGVPFVIRRKK